MPDTTTTEDQLTPEQVLNALPARGIRTIPQVAQTLGLPEAQHDRIHDLLERLLLDGKVNMRVDDREWAYAKVRSASRKHTEGVTAADFDFTTVADLAAKIVDQDPDGQDDMGAIEALHTLIFTALGSTADDIAAKLAELDVQGTRPDQDGEPDNDGTMYGDLCDYDNCALAVFFRQVCGATSASFGTDGGTLCWDGTEPGSEVSHEGVTLPATVAAFQHGYEDFKYPGLYKD